MWIIFAYLALGAGAGLLAGLLGIGGGLVIVPVLYYLFEVQQFAPEVTMHLAIGSSLATIVFTAIASTYAHHRRRAVRWSVVSALAPGIVLGALLGAKLADYLANEMLRALFGVFELIVAVQLGLGLRPQVYRGLPGTLGIASVGTVIGGVSAILGIGGGTLTVPFLVWCNVVIRQAVATSAACGLPIALAGSVGFVIMGWNNASLPPRTHGYVYWPAVAGVVFASTACAPLGARLAHTLPVMTLRKLFAVLLVIIGLRMLI